MPPPEPGPRRLDPAGFWSATDFPYTCLRDRERTRTLGAVVAATVAPGDVVLDAGAGTGILALQAARAGAAKVHAVEIDPVLCRLLRETVRRNGYDEVIEVVEADVTEFGAATVDVALIEMVETALVDEALVEVYNALLVAGTVGPTTRCLPRGYTTIAQPVHTDNRFDGFEVVALRHDWSHYERDPAVWGTSRWQPTGPAQAVWSGSFAGSPVEPDVVVRLSVPDPLTNGVRLTGEMEMPDGTHCTEFPSLNGPKIVPLPPWPGDSATVELRYRLSGGFPGFAASWLPATGG